MTDRPALFALNRALDRPAIRAALAENRLVQVENFLEAQSAETLWQVLQQQTPFGLAWAGDGQPHGQHVRAEQIPALSAEQKMAMGNAAANAAAAGRFAFLYAQYPLVEAYVQKWHPGHPLYGLLEEVNAAPVLDFARDVSGHADIIKADGQATLYAGGHFLTDHDDLVEVEGRRLAYVLNLAKDWKPDWGGYLNFMDAKGNIVAGFMPRFNTMNLFLVPLRHNVSLVPSFAPVGRFAITGWFRNR
ncbi:2OG-Fe(II) oxygenase family protein [Sandarakinorhabdus sp. AAP62]|uniref:2OG-Fe(II) oxygenase n=1 Tax=Sandarakinorhabdus sp. AAP62 TaxID=1248916 RepID=UPI00031465E0|nr:2OG-Fe(II) oxygenase family protein [Sandarakinorhabdus sp. AAP62]